MLLLKTSDITQKSHSVKVLDHHRTNKSQIATTPIVEEEIGATPDFHFEDG
jgi:hypothetical protein